jgi:hypothetical protein
MVQRHASGVLCFGEFSGTNQRGNGQYRPKNDLGGLKMAVALSTGAMVGRTPVGNHKAASFALVCGAIFLSE